MREYDERGVVGMRQPPEWVRDQRLQLATDMLALALRDVAVLPTRQQEQVRLAMKALVDVQQWCRAHAQET
jgi:hypothetical protein